MKHLLKRNSGAIYAMAYPRQIALAKFTDLSAQISYHIIKFVVYKEQRPETLNHWLTEISTWMNTASQTKCKSRLKESDYLDTLFGEFGDEAIDSEVNLKEFKRKFVNVTFNPCPEFEITPQLVSELFSTYQNFIQVSMPYFLCHQVLSTQEWKRVLQDTLY